MKMKRKLMVGLAVKDITPDFSTSLHGYRPRNSNGVHDRLYANCVVFATADCKVAIISISVVLINAECTASIRKGAAEATGIPETNILVHATHTHSAPLVTGAYSE